jgi:hypothetical protein
MWHFICKSIRYKKDLDKNLLTTGTYRGEPMRILAYRHGKLAIILKLTPILVDCQLLPLKRQL